MLTLQTGQVWDRTWEVGTVTRLTFSVAAIYNDKVNT